MTTVSLEKFNVNAPASEIMKMIKDNGKLLDHTNEAGEKVRFASTLDPIRQGDIYLVPLNKDCNPKGMEDITKGHSFFPYGSNSDGGMLSLTPATSFERNTHVLLLNGEARVFVNKDIDYSPRNDRLLSGPVIDVGNESVVVTHHEHAPVGLLPNTRYGVFYQEDYQTSQRVRD